MATRPTVYKNRKGIRVRRNLDHATSIESIQQSLRNKKFNTANISVAGARDRGKPSHRVKQISG